MLNEDFCRFYSPQWLGATLIESLGTTIPESIVDLGSGPGVLAKAANDQWTGVSIVTVDLDGFAHQSLPIWRRHVQADALNSRLGAEIGIAASSIDVVISNPPYRRSIWKPGFKRILERVGFGDVVAEPNHVPTDLVFLAQAMYLVRSGGLIGFIVPDTMISGASMAKARETLLSQHAVQRVIQLPRRAFKGTDAQAYIVVVRKDHPSTTVKLEMLDLAGRWSEPIEIAPSDGVQRLDYAYHAAARPRDKSALRLDAIGTEISRGRATSVEVAAATDKIFHTCDFPTIVGASIALNAVEPSTSTPSNWAAVGDILLARVDRRIEDKIAYVSRGAGPISDCVLRVRVPEALRLRVLAGLVSPRGRSQLTARIRGTGARHISATSLMDFVV